MNRTSMYINLRQCIFECTLYIYLILSILSNSFFSRYIFNYNILLLIIYALLIVQEFFWGRYTKKVLSQILSVCFFIFLVLFSKNTGLSNPIIPLMLFSIIGRNLDFKKILNHSFKIIFCLVIFIILSSQLGIITDYIAIQNGRTRHFLGFLYALYPGAFILELVLIAIYLNKTRFVKFVLLCLGCYVYMMTNSRLSFLLTIFALILCTNRVVQFVHKIASSNFLKVIMSFIYGFFALVSVILCYFYNPSVRWQNILNRILSFRLRLSNDAIQQYGITLFGKPVSFTGAAVNSYGVNLNQGKEYITVDNGYLDILIKYGIVTEILFIVLISVLLYKLLSTHNFLLYIIFCIIGVHLLVDFSMINLIYNVFVLILFYQNSRLMILNKR